MTSLPIEPLKHATLSEEIAERLVQSILAGKFEFGEQLPPERDLAKYLDVGRPTLREALRTLSVLGLLEVRRGEGTFIVNQHSAFVSRAFGWAVLLDPGPVRQVAELRVAIESETARLAARRATADDHQQLDTLVHAMEAVTAEPVEFAQHDIRFHLELARMADNVMLERVLVAIRSLLERWIGGALQLENAGEMALYHHRRIADAVRRNDEVAAATEMREHIEATAKLMETALATAGDGADLRQSARQAPEHDVA